MIEIILYPKLKAIMVERGIQRKDLADYLGISLDSFNKRMQGYSEFTQAEKMVLSDFFDIPLPELFRKREEEKR